MQNAYAYTLRLKVQEKKDSLPKKKYKENHAAQKLRSQDQTFSTTKERLRNPNVDSYPNIS